MTDLKLLRAAKVAHSVRMYVGKASITSLSVSNVAAMTMGPDDGDVVSEPSDNVVQSVPVALIRNM